MDGLGLQTQPSCWLRMRSALRIKTLGEALGYGLVPLIIVKDDKA